MRFRRVNHDIYKVRAGDGSRTRAHVLYSKTHEFTIKIFYPESAQNILIATHLNRTLKLIYIHSVSENSQGSLVATSHSASSCCWRHEERKQSGQ